MDATGIDQNRQRGFGIAIRVAVVLVVTSVACERPAGPRSDTSPDGAIYAAIIDSLYLGPRHERVVVFAERFAQPMVTSQMLRTRFGPDLPAELAERFVEETQSPGVEPLTDITARVPIERFNTDIQDSLHTASGRSADRFWQLFYDRYPDSPGLLRFSAAAIDSEGTQALVTVQRGCGSLCGEIEVIRLRAVDGRWMILERWLLLIS